MKKTTAFICIDPKGEMLPMTIRESATESRRSMCGDTTKWNEWYNKGWRCKKGIFIINTNKK